MSKMYITLEKRLIMKVLIEQIKNEVHAKRICSSLEKISDKTQDEERLRQMRGIKKAKEMGITFGRPRIDEPDNFSQIVEDWKAGNMDVKLAARACDMGVSTFYRRARDYMDKKKGLVLKQIKE